MKVLIWFACLFFFNGLLTLFRMGGVIIGGIPTLVVYVVMIAAARKLCQLWDEHCKKREEKRDSVLSQDEK